MNPVVSVCGSDASHINGSDSALNVAELVGGEIARRGAVLVCGGRGGVMEASCRGAKQQGGMTIGILPDECEVGNAFLDVRIPTNIWVPLDL